MSDQVEIPIRTARDPRAAVRDWRLHVLIEAGYPIDAAEKLADRHDIDLHIAVDLLGHGCAAELALEILT